MKKRTRRASKAKSSARSSSQHETDPQKAERGAATLSASIALKCVRFAGVSLGGAKTDKTAVAILEYYPEQKRVFLRSIRDKISDRADRLGDETLLEILNQDETDLTFVAFDAPLQLPKCLRCDLPCPGVMACREPEIRWMRDLHQKRKKLKRPNKMFTPYTERASEIYIAHELEEVFHPSHALGSNAAPLTARVHFLARRLVSPLIEVYPKLSLWRIGVALAIPKSHLRFHKHAVDSDEARLFILKTLIEREIAFIYQQDLRLMVENSCAFDAFICALTGFLKYRGQTERRPAGFPKDEVWLEFPKSKINWF